MFNVDVDRSANAPLLLPSLKEHRCIGIVLWEQQLYYMYYTRYKDADI